MSGQKTIDVAGDPSYWDEYNGVRVHLIDFGTDQAYGFAASTVEPTGADGLFVCVSQHLPAERRGKVVRAMLDSRAKGRAVVPAVAA